MALYAKALLPILCGQAISRKITFCKTQVMNSIKQIGFTYTILSTDADNIFSELKLLLVIIFELKKRYRLYKKIQERSLKNEGTKA